MTPVPCDACQSNGGLVKDLEHYPNPRPSDRDNDAVKPCAECDGTGRIILPWKI